MKFSAEYFWSKVRKTETCWLFEGNIRQDGYGRVGDRTAHRLVLELVGRKTGAVVCHTCENRNCVNPGHLYSGTQKDNMADRMRAGKYATGERHPRAKLKDADYPKIVARVRAGETQTAVAKAFGISQVRVSQILRKF